MGSLDNGSIISQSGALLGTNLEEEHLRGAEVIWNYMSMGHKLQKSELILVLGNNDIRVAEHASRLWKEGFADYIMFSGNLGNLTEGIWSRPEYEVFREVALGLGVPADRILVETRATNTGQNVRFSYDVLKALGRVPRHSIILVQTPYMERRTFATFMRQWPEEGANLRVQVSSPPLTLRQYPNASVGPLAETICIMLGCLQRIITYPAKGYQVSQDVPEHVDQAYQKLLSSGLYSNFLVKT